MPLEPLSRVFHMLDKKRMMNDTVCYMANLKIGSSMSDAVAIMTGALEAKKLAKGM